MTIATLVLGIINIGIVVALLLLLGLLVVWIAGMFGAALPSEARKVYIIFVLLVAVYMLAALLLGLPSWHIVSVR